MESGRDMLAQAQQLQAIQPQLSTETEGVPLLRRDSFQLAEQLGLLLIAHGELREAGQVLALLQRSVEAAAAPAAAATVAERREATRRSFSVRLALVQHSFVCGSAGTVWGLGANGPARPASTAQFALNRAQRATAQRLAEEAAAELGPQHQCALNARRLSIWLGFRMCDSASGESCHCVCNTVHCMFVPVG